MWVKASVINAEKSYSLKTLLKLRAGEKSACICNFVKTSIHVYIKDVISYI